MGVAEVGKVLSISMMRWSRTRARASCEENSRSVEFAGKAAVPEQVGRFFKAGFLGEIVDVDAAVGQHAGFTINETNAGISGNNSFKTLANDRGRHSF